VSVPGAMEYIGEEMKSSKNLLELGFVHGVLIWLYKEVRAIRLVYTTRTDKATKTIESNMT
jgi:hypothetical protein